MEALDHELGSVGFYVGGHPLETSSVDLSKYTAAEKLETMTAGAYRMVGVVRKRQERVSKRGKRFAFLELSDPTGNYEVLVTEKLLTAKRDIMTAGHLVCVHVSAESNDGELRIFAENVTMLDGASVSASAAEAAKAAPAGLKIRLRKSDIETLDELKATLERLRSSPFQMSGYIELILPLNEKREGAWRLEGRWAIDPSVRKAIKANSAVETIAEIAA